MSTTHIQPLPNVRGRMSYTELGEGKKRTRNIREKTNRIAAQMGDMGTREDFIRFCSAMRRQSQGTRLNEGYELRVSWSPEELSRDSPEDIQRACEYGYALCKEVAPNAPCWVTVHTDGEGGCVHVHATIANHDLESGTAIAHGTDHATVKRKNDRLSREMGFTVVGPEPAREKTTWAERKGQFGIESFERVLGNRVADARDHASNMEEFLEELKVRGVERTETRKVDEKTGEETVGWSYPHYDNYDAIEVPFVEAIPSDYDGVMGVPITFMDKYSPDQFEILGCSYNYGRPSCFPSGCCMASSVNDQDVYKRLFVRNKRPEL